MRTLRPATPADIPALYALDLLCFAAPFRFSLSDMRRYVFAPTSITLIADDPAGRGIAAFIVVELAPPHAYVITLDVDPAHRRLGLARQLLGASEAHALGKGINTLHLHVSVDNVPALALYRSLGYSVTSEEPNFYARSRSAFTLMKVIAPAAEA